MIKQIKDWWSSGSFSVLCFGVTLVMTPILGGVFSLIWVLGETGILVK